MILLSMAAALALVGLAAGIRMALVVAPSSAADPGRSAAEAGAGEPDPGPPPPPPTWWQPEGGAPSPARDLADPPAPEVERDARAAIANARRGTFEDLVRADQELAGVLAREPGWGEAVGWRAVVQSWLARRREIREEPVAGTWGDARRLAEEAVALSREDLATTTREVRGDLTEARGLGTSVQALDALAHGQRFEAARLADSIPMAVVSAPAQLTRALFVTGGAADRGAGFLVSVRQQGFRVEADLTELRSAMGLAQSAADPGLRHRWARRALELATEATEASSDVLELWLCAAEATRLAGRPMTQTLELLDRAQALDPGLPTVPIKRIVMLAEALETGGHGMGLGLAWTVREAIAKARAQGLDDAALDYAEGLVEARDGDRKKALDLLKRALAPGPEERALRKAISLALGLGDLDFAVRASEALTGLRRDDPWVRRQLVDTLGLLARSQEAARAKTLAIETWLKVEAIAEPKQAETARREILRLAPPPRKVEVTITRDEGGTRVSESRTPGPLQSGASRRPAPN